MRPRAFRPLLAAAFLASAPAAWAQALTPPASSLSSLGKSTQVASPGFPELGPIANGHDVTISDVVRLALVANRAIAHARASYLTSRGQVQEAYAALFPTIGSAVEELRLNQAISNKFLTVTQPSTPTEPIGAVFESQRIQQRIYSIGGSIPIDISGELRAVVSQTKYERLATQLDLSRVVNDQVAAVKSAFYDVLRAQALQKVAENDLAVAQLTLKDAQSRYAAQVVTKFDVLRAQTDEQAAEQVLIAAKNRVEQLYAVLDNVIGIRGDIRLHAIESGAVTEPSATDAPAGYAAGSPVAEQYIDTALKQRPEVLEADADVRAAQEGLRIAVRSEMPTLSLGYSYNYNPDAGGSNPVYHQWVASALFSVPLFDSGLARARAEEAKGQIQNSLAGKRDAQDQVTLDVQQALISVSDAEQRVKVANVSLTNAQAAYDLANFRYQQGVSSHAGISPLLEVSDAAAALSLAESNQVNALYDYNNAESLLSRALGDYTKNANSK